MASYQPTILPPPKQYGLIPGLAQGFSSSSGPAANAYGEAMIKDKYAQKKSKRDEEAMNKFMASMQQDPNMEIDQVSMDESGNPKYTYKRKTSASDVFSKDPVKAIKNAMLGFGTEGVGQAMGIPEQQAMTPASPGSPPMSQVNTQGGEFMPNYGDVVKKSLIDQYAPGYTPEQVSRDVMGLPAETAAEKMTAEQGKIPQEFTNDVENLKNVSADNMDAFITGLERLSLKYAGNPDALQRIKLIKSIIQEY